CRAALYFFFQAEDGIRGGHVTGVQTCALPIFMLGVHHAHERMGNAQHDRRRPATRSPSQQQIRPSVARLGFAPPSSHASAGSRRSEERRVGKECRSWWARDHKKKKVKVIIPKL